MSSGTGSADPWAWLGLLKWTLAHQDGTKPSDLSPMSAEDKAFLEKVMKEGIIDENERMKFILQEFSKAMEYYQSLSQATTTQEQPPLSPISEDALEDLLQELRDIVEQVDYARAFVAMKGPTYLLGAITASTGIPESIRNQCLGILATLAQNNPPVQKGLLEIGAIKTLSDIFLHEDEDHCPMDTKVAIMQAMSAMIRNYDVTETVFEHLLQAPELMVKGLDPDPVMTNEKLRLKTLFFLNAFLTSDTSSSARVQKFVDAIKMIADPQYLDDGSHDRLRELSISMLQQLLERRWGVRLLLRRKELLASLGVQRISAMRALTGDEAELARTELEQWESFLVLLARANPEDENDITNSTTTGNDELKRIEN
jgi:hsp70-interacting protein